MPRVAVMGGSLGGLNAALWLQGLGCEVTVFERSPSPLQARGAGIAALHQTLRWLELHGPDPETVCSSTDRITFLEPDGSIRGEIEHRYLFSSWNTIYRTFLTAFGEQHYRMASAVSSFTDEGDVVRLVLADGGTAEADLLVCADGVNSTARPALVPETVSRYAGYVAWRGTVPESELSPATFEMLADRLTYQALPDSHILVYPIPGPDGATARGERLTNMVWYRNVEAGDPLTELMTDVTGRVREVSLPPGAARPELVDEVRRTAREVFAQAVAEVVCAVAQPFAQAIVDVEVPVMARGRVCLLGDAAFAVRPHAAAGTAKATEDGWKLAEHLHATDGDVLAALAAWNDEQVALGSALLQRTRTIGDRSQFGGGLSTTDPDILYGLYRPGD
jgi:2,6-dihydroxypyridine 3-monooxygenase